MRRVLNVWLLIVAAIFLNSVKARELQLKGRVSSEGKALEGVWVSDGESFARTDKRGCYTLEANDENAFVFVCVPAGYEAKIEDGVLRHFLPMPKEAGAECNFELDRRPYDDRSHSLIALADPQIWAEKEFQKLAVGADDIREVVESRPERVFHGICLGDIVANQPKFYKEYNRTMQRANIPLRNIIGNHDMSIYIRSHEGSTREYGEMYGPAYYSFDVGEVHYVVLNDNFYIGRDWYYIAYLDERQLSWLEKDLSHQTPGQVVVVSMHIPSTCTPVDRESFNYQRIEAALVNYKALYELLEPFNAHILSGHTHTAFNSEVRENLYDHVIPAMSGAWWQGALCTDGTPNGYAVFDFDGDQVSWYYKSVGEHRDYQMRLYSGKEYKEFEGYVVANVWNCDSKWRVEFLFDGEPSEEAAERFTAIDPAARELYSSNEGLDHQWIGPTEADHFYRAPMPQHAKMVEVRVTDRFGRVYTESLSLK